MDTIDNQRIKKVVDYLKNNRYIRNQQDFTERIGSDKATVSQVINNRINIPNNMFASIADAFPFVSEDWMRTGEGDMVKATNTQHVKDGEYFTQTGDVNAIPADILHKALDEISEMRKALTQALTTNQSHTERLLGIVENMTSK